MRPCLFAVAATRLSCPIDDSLHVLAAHALPVVVGAALSAIAGTRGSGRGSPRRRIGRPP